VPLFARRLRELAGERTAGDVARSTGLGLGTVTKLLNGETDPRLSTLMILANEFGLRSIEELLIPFGTAKVVGDLSQRSEDDP